MGTLIAVDGTNLGHRAFHALKENAAGTAIEDVFAVQGFFSLLARLMNQVSSPSHLVLAFDSPGGCTWRTELFDGYKAGRSAPDPRLFAQLDAIEHTARQLGLCALAEPGHEADDFIASAVATAEQQAASSVVISSDKDLHQLISNRTLVLKPEGVVFDEAKIAAKYDISADRWVEFAAICGEGADNLPGIPGLGPKAAVKLISNYAHVEDALADPDVATVLGKAAATKLAAGIESFRTCEQIGRLDRNLDIDFDAATLAGIEPRQVYATLSEVGVENAASSFAAAVLKAQKN